MWIKELNIKDFRIFKEQLDLNLSKNITCISGHNGIGKSTILAILSNCGEIKGDEGRHLNGKTFRGEFADIIKGDKEFDTTGDKAKIKFADIPSNKGKSVSDPEVYVEEMTFRAHFSQDRYRLIPKKIKGVRETESKVKWPIYYLGLSRLYPVGESSSATGSNLSEEINEKLVADHSNILSIDYGENVTSKNIGIREGNVKKVGIKTKKFSETANSAGQDNLGQIILTILSFEKLKNENPEDYHGGLFIIDEIDATLHPAAQRRLFDYLLNKSEELNLQIVFTTHSYTLIEHMLTKREHKSNRNKIKIIYIERREKSLKVREDAPLAYYKNDLTDTYVGGNVTDPKVKVFTEDEIARQFITMMFETKNYSPQIELLDLNISWNTMLNLLVSDFSVLQNYIFILDPDLYIEENYNKAEEILQGYPEKLNEFGSNVLILPTDNPDKARNIERMLYEYITENISDDHVIFDDKLFLARNWSQKMIIDNGIHSEQYSDYKESYKYKRWYEDNKYMLKHVTKYWLSDYENPVNQFIKKFDVAYKKLEKD